MSMPWDELQPESELPYAPPPPTGEPVPLPSPEPDTEPPDPTEEYVPPPPKPIPVTPTVDVGALAKDVGKEALDYVKAALAATMKGQDVEILKPTVTAVTAEGKELIVADARSRSWRTLLQGLAIDLFAALLAVAAVLSGMDPLVKETWILVGALLVKTLVQTAVAYFMRIKVTPTVRMPGEKMAIMPIPRPMVDEERVNAVGEPGHPLQFVKFDEDKTGA